MKKKTRKELKEIQKKVALLYMIRNISYVIVGALLVKSQLLGVRWYHHLVILVFIFMLYNSYKTDKIL